MDRFDRIYDLHKLLSSARLPVSREKIEQELECSRATAKRIIDSMRLYLDAPIKYDRMRNGYYYDRSEKQLYELPGLWFNASELHALLSVQQLLSDVQPGLFDKQLAPLRSRIEQLLGAQDQSSTNLQQRVKILHMAARPAGEFFQPVAGATMQRKRLQIDYFKRSDQQTESREISPQRLVHYRDNWYLDAWCHTRDALRTFALDAIRKARVLDQPALDVDETQLDAHYGSSYGIFSGRPNATAVLLFSAGAAQWIQHEQWHPQQHGQLLEDGRYRLEIPFNNPIELIMDILRYGADVVVEQPESLRQQIQQKLRLALQQYEAD
ncbi:MAG: YafY family protein [Chromatiales bacterium]|jgi:predicted DNA-binding transcriptional regulator YafY